jgi:ubiquinone/menaquinone biosynthesis C-methylase UbiE
MTTNDYTNKAKFYAAENITGTGYLAYRDIIKFIPSKAKQHKTLDFGCGTGRSTRLLKNYGLNVTGVDISDAMLSQARKLDTDSVYRLIDANRMLPFKTNEFYLVVSTLVLFELESLERMEKALFEINRIMHHDGKTIFVTGSEYMYSHKWLSIFPITEKKSFSSGELVKIKLKENLILSDYFWTNHDYQHVFQKAGFVCETIHYPTGLKDEYEWVSEQNYSPYVLYVLKKYIKP